MNFQQLSTLYPTITIQYDDALSNYTYTKTGGLADVTVFPKTKTEVKQIVDWAREQNAPLTILGNASNLIVRDGGIRGIVMILTDLNSVTATEDGQLIADSGARLIDVSYRALTEELTGLEFACGIPGSIGGAVFMNAGAYGGEVKEVITSVEVITREGEFKTYRNADCDFSYRHSVFQTNSDIVLSVTFQLTDGEPIAIKEEMDHLTDLRESKQPLEYPSCGSVFKRPVGYYTGKLIQDAGLQGYRIGGAEISRKHAGFIVNVDKATATDYTDMIEFIQERIWDLNQVRLEPEVRIIGENPKA
ncbi:UDP-N-acetylmuramate dehydrogenase [Fundicoccus ignavus]|uniref:UDP-N-acetylenolpyruvoylglucosamine reductase n=1 Tax=Fundicoccus ignavus TaxID=2664442 RepID=A0A6I2GLM2_9LACT|nr:UDP-N-acetylmuramate dehydrogenase [Fundicoccus ignavus]MRI81088.1 UDP-N-acetylmuramate dehydrogenase [Fundicoccus ignavus]MRI86159.1 UDP-N-acetylmuramate dehydrogenase [Fundicoccus ignavus]MRJ46055.1 UDP-N-acetylmuramate dehydrogenase [Fundicoccus ignavus]